MQRTRLFFMTPAVLLTLCACSSKPPASPAVSTGPAEAVAWSPNGWSNPERAEGYHLAEGSELMPYALVANVVSVKTGKPFLENMERFGFVADAKSASNPHCDLADARYNHAVRQEGAVAVMS